MIIDEKEYAKAIINYFELYSNCVTLYDQELPINETIIKEFDELIGNIKCDKIDLNKTHEQLVNELGTYISFINQIGDKEYNSVYENIRKSFGVGKEVVDNFGNMLINTNDESTAYNKILAIIPTDELAQEFIKLEEEKDLKKF